MKIVHVHVALETPDDATEVAEVIGAVLAYGLKNLRPEWKVKVTH